MNRTSAVLRIASLVDQGPPATQSLVEKLKRPGAFITQQDLDDGIADLIDDLYKRLALRGQTVRDLDAKVASLQKWGKGEICVCDEELNPGAICFLCLRGVVKAMLSDLQGLAARREFITEPRLINWRDVVNVMTAEAELAICRPGVAEALEVLEVKP